MNLDVHLPTLGLVLGSAAIDSINPCAIGVLILMISVILGGLPAGRQGRKSVGKMLYLGGLYIFSIFITSIFLGINPFVCN